MKWGLEECLAGTGRAEDRVGSEMDNSTLTRLVNLGHQAAHQHIYLLITGYTPPDPSGMCNGPESQDEASAPACLKNKTA